MTPSRDARVQRVIALIGSDLSTRWCRKKFARQAYLSESQLCRLFKQEVGVSLSAYVRHQRLARAAELLSSTNHSVKEIGSTVGFVSESHFDRCFKAHYGSTPVQFRFTTRAVMNG